MAFELIDDSITAVAQYKSSGNVDLVAGQHCKIESSPMGIDYADWVCPAGKVWTISIGVSIIETDA